MKKWFFMAVLACYTGVLAMDVKTTKVGVAVMIFNDKNQVLLGLRQGSHGAGTWHTPGGHLEFQESIELTAKREVMEEIGAEITDITHIGVTNDIFVQDGKHFITMIVATKLRAGQVVKNMEPDKCKQWKWFDLNNLPTNLFITWNNFFAGKAIQFNHRLYKRLMKRKNPF